MSLFLAAMLAATAPAPAPAVPTVVSAANPQSVVSALQRAGYQAKLEKDDEGDPMISSGANGHNFSIFFYGCEKNLNCETVQFFAGWSEHKANLESMNRWNRDNRFGRAYIAESGAARVEMDVDLADGGVSPLLFEDNVEFWTIVMGKFYTFIQQ